MFSFRSIPNIDSSYMKYKFAETFILFLYGILRMLRDDSTGDIKGTHGIRYVCTIIV